MRVGRDLPHRALLRPVSANGTARSARPRRLGRLDDEALRSRRRSRLASCRGQHEQLLARGRAWLGRLGARWEVDVLQRPRAPPAPRSPPRIGIQPIRALRLARHWRCGTPRAGDAHDPPGVHRIRLLGSAGNSVSDSHPHLPARQATGVPRKRGMRASSALRGRVPFMPDDPHAPVRRPAASIRSRPRRRRGSARGW